MKVPVSALNLADLARSASRWARPHLLPAIFAGMILASTHPAAAALSLRRGSPSTVGCVRYANSPDSVTITAALTGPGTITSGLAIPANRIQYDIINCDVGPMFTWTVYYSPAVGPDIIGAFTPLGYIDFTGTIVPQGGVAYTTLFNAGFGVYNYNTGAPWIIDYEPDHITFSTTASPPGLPANDGVGYLNPTYYLPSFAILFNPNLANGLVPASAMVGSVTMNGQVLGPLPGNPCLSIICSNIVVETCSNCVPVTYSATALDPCCTNANLQFNPPSGTCFPVNKTTTVTVSAYDSCGNVATNYFTVTVNPDPNCAPTNCIKITAADITAYTCNPCTPVVYNVFATDNCCPGAAPTLIFNPPPGTCFPVGSTTVNVTAYDQCGKTNTGTFTVMVSPGPDCGNTNCIQINATDIVAQTCSSCTTVPFNVTVSDQCCTAGGLTVTYNPPTNTCFPLNSMTTVQIKASDACGNTATKFITVKVVPGPNCNPTNCITIYSSNIVVYTCGNCTNVSYNASVLDTCCAVGASLSFNPPETYCFPLGSTTVNVSASDQCGNGAVSSFTVTVLPAAGCGPTGMLPVYHVDQFGATAAQAGLMASAFDIPSPPQTDARGVVHYLDYTNYLTVPSASITDQGVISLLQGQTVNESPAIPLQFQQPDFSALSNLTVFDPNSALLMTSNALASAGLTPQYGVAMVAQPVFTVICTNPGFAQPISNSVPLDTEVNYQFTLPGGYPLEGSGAQAQFAFGSGGNVTRLLYAVPHLSPGQMVQIIPMSNALSRAAALMDPTHSLGNLNLTGSIAYRCILCPPPCVEGPIYVLPYVKVTGSILQTNKVTGEVSTLDLMPQYVLATDDPAFSPQVTLSASSIGSTQVVASVRVAGGTPPYTYTWGGSSPTVISNTGSAVGYFPTYRATPPPLLTTYVQALHKILIHWWTTEPDPHPWVLESSADLSQGPAGWAIVPSDVQTSNGISTVELDATAPKQFFRLRLASQTVPITETLSVQVTDANGATVRAIQSVAVQATVQPAIPARGANVIDWGTESPYDPGLGTGDRDSWRTGMIAGGAGVERFLWTGTSSWKEDFIDAPAGIDDYEVDNADITLYIGHGNPVVFTFTGGPGPNPTTLFYNDATHSWGGWDAEWLCLLSCEVLQYDWSGLKAWQRWGPNFDGLHTLLGFSTPAYAGTGFPATFTSAMLGTWGTIPVPIVSAWFNAAHECGTGTPAAMGPLGPGSATDYGDHFWGRGPVGPTIRSSQILGWWYISY